MDYELYHDESLKDGYWHGMLLVPCQSKNYLVGLLDESRSSINYKYPVAWKKLRGPGKKATIIECWIHIGISSLVSRLKGESVGFFTGSYKDGHRVYKQLSQVIGCKFILFRERDNFKKMEYFSDSGSKVEINLRMGLKGGLHYLGCDDEYINLVRLHFDNHEHYQRNISRERIIGRLDGLRDYCSISQRSDLIDDRSSDHRRADAQEYDDCQLLQLTDVLLGAFRTVFMGPSKSIHKRLVTPAKRLIERYSKGYVRMRNSKWRNALCISQCYLSEKKWHFDSLDIVHYDDSSQMPLPLSEQ